MNKNKKCLTPYLKALTHTNQIVIGGWHEGAWSETEQAGRPVTGTPVVGVVLLQRQPDLIVSVQAGHQ